jgi:hypothetical protein
VAGKPAYSGVSKGTDMTPLQVLRTFKGMMVLRGDNDGHCMMVKPKRKDDPLRGDIPENTLNCQGLDCHECPFSCDNFEALHEGLQEAINIIELLDTK